MVPTSLIAGEDLEKDDLCKITEDGFVFKYFSEDHPGPSDNHKTNDMSLEKQIERLADGVEALVKILTLAGTAAVTSAAAAPAKPAVEPAAAAPAAPAAAKNDEKKDTKATIGVKEIRDLGLKLIQAGKSDAFKAVLTKHGVDAVSKLDPKVHADVHAELTKLTA